MLEVTLRHLIPFRFLSDQGRAALVERAVVVAHEPLRWIVRQGDAHDRRVFIVLKEHVEIVDEPSGAPLGHIEQGRYFGERAALFDTPRQFSVRAGARGATVAALEQDDFLALLADEPALAHALGNILRSRQGIFRAFDAFMAELHHGVTHQVVHFRELRQLYMALEPALHPHVKDPHTIDFEAMRYALSRLPEGMTQAFMIYLTDTLHDHLVGPSQLMRHVPTRARRRHTFEMVHGKLLIMLRDGDSDLIDLVTCLCAFATEARKLRQRIQRSNRLLALVQMAQRQEHDQDEALEALGFDAHERAELMSLWPGHALQRLHQIAMHHEDYQLQITKQLQGYNTQHAERWTHQIAQAVEQLMGSPPDALTCPVHIISSNTHSVQNCLSPYLRERADEIRRWGERHHPELLQVSWHDPSDLLYALARPWLRAHPEELDLQRDMERHVGMVTLEQTALTGLEVELIDTAALDLSRLDPTILPAPLDAHARAQRALIVNIDYAFGQQAEEIMAILLMLFGQRVRSVNVLGKAGALRGRRGDLLVATSFIEQTQDVLEPLHHVNACQIERLGARVPDRQLHVGPVLTVAGTLLQNRTLLNFYRRIWQCVGLEMEGTFYLREILKASHLGMISPEVELRFLYYVSDVPLAAGESLAGALQPGEGIPALYAITREILQGVLSPLVWPPR